MENEFMKRGYLLPDGCKNLADAMKLPKRVAKAQTSTVSISHPLPPAKGIVIIHKHMNDIRAGHAARPKPIPVYCAFG